MTRFGLDTRYGGVELRITSQHEEQAEDPITVAEVEGIAKKRLTAQVWDYYASGSDEGRALKENFDAFDRLKIIPRVMIDVAHVDISTSLFGKTYSLPIGIAPSAMQKLVGGDGEVSMARAAANMNVNMTLSSQATTTLEEVMEARNSVADGLRPGFWHQLYLTRDPEKSIPLIRRAEAAGYDALVLTVDTPVLGNRLNERKVPLALPAGLRLANVEANEPKSQSQVKSQETRGEPKEKKPSTNRLLMDARNSASADAVTKEAGGNMHSPSLTWDATIPWLRKNTSMKIILKGILSPVDADLAVQHGVDAIIVSNHGGRQLDSAPSTIEMLPDIAKAVAGRIPIIMDGGIRRGSDVYKALALGADFVLVGRAVLWGLAFKGQEGVECVLNILEREFSRTMALAGVRNIDELKGHLGRESVGVSKIGGWGISRL